MATKTNFSVIIVNRFFGGSQTPTGRMAADVAKAMLDSGSIVRVLTSKSQYVKSETQDLSPACEVHVLWTRMNAGRLESWLFFWLQAFFVLLVSNWNRCLLMTDPPFMIFFAPLLKLLRPKCRIYWWTMDLYPEALVASDIKFPLKGWVTKILTAWTNVSIGSLDRVICLGQIQRKRLQKYSRFEKKHGKTCAVIPPWDMRAIAASQDEIAAFKAKRGWQTKKIALYAGNLGEAHEYQAILDVAESLYQQKDTSWLFCFFCRGARVRDLQTISQHLPNVSVNDYLPDSETSVLLLSADVHLISMGVGWEGVVVPSKLYGILSTRAPVVFFGPLNSDTGLEIARLKIGLTIDAGTEGGRVAKEFQRISDRSLIVDDLSRPQQVSDMILSEFS